MRGVPAEPDAPAALPWPISSRFPCWPKICRRSGASGHPCGQVRWGPRFENESPQSYCILNSF